ncbi:unnamed protein product [Rotaria sp. Silwood1]|nr:unnamed protein product [Rotaria sp. Silwood1]
MDRATAIVAFVIHHEDQSRVQFELFPKLRMIELRIDGRLLEFTPLSDPDELASSSLIYSDDRQLIIRQSDIHSYSISYGESGIQFLVYVRQQLDFLDLVSILSSTFKANQQFQGLLGGFQGLTHPDGTSVSVSASLNDDQALFPYGESWRTTSDSSLFYYRVQDSHAQHQDLTHRPVFLQELFNKYANTSRYQMAKEACQQMAYGQQCIFDVLITNDATISQMHEKYETTLQSVEEYIELVNNDIEIRKNRTTTTPVIATTPIMTGISGTASSTTGHGTSKPENSAANYLVHGVWQIVLLTSIIVGYSC